MIAQLFSRSFARSLAVRRAGAVARPTSRAASSPANAAPSSPASSVGGFGLLLPITVVAVAFVVIPIAALHDGAEPGPVAGWMAMVAVVLAASWFWEGRRQAAELRNLRKPRVSNYSATEHYQAQWGTTERCEMPENPAPVPSRRGFWQRVARWAAPELEDAPARPLEAAVPLYVIDPPGWGRNADYPEVLEARPACILEVIDDEFNRAKPPGCRARV